MKVWRERKVLELKKNGQKRKIPHFEIKLVSLRYVFLAASIVSDAQR